MTHADRDAQARMFENRLRKRSKHLHKWARRHGITCYRLYDRDIPEIPISVDIYHGRAAHLYIARYQRKREPDAVAEWMDAMAHAAGRALEIPVERIHIKERQRQRGSSQYERMAGRNQFMTVTEGGHSFAVNLDDYLDTGLFLDHRPLRLRIQEEAHGARFLNLFCYTGSFTVYAAKGGARSSLSIDLSQRYLDWAERNLSLNHIDSSGHRLLRADVCEFLRSRPPERFDLVVLDPPTFSNSKNMDGVLDIQRDHPELIDHTLDLMSKGGVLYFSTNARRLKLATDRIKAVDPASIADITQDTIPEDFRNRYSHRCFRMVK